MARGWGINPPPRVYVARTRRGGYARSTGRDPRRYATCENKQSVELPILEPNHPRSRQTAIPSVFSAEGGIVRNVATTDPAAR